jgi:small conductance mechanosensitive channel
MSNVISNILSGLKKISLSSISAEQLVLALLTLFICLLVIRLLTRFINKAITRLPIEQSLHSFVRSLAKILLYFLTIIIVADTLGIPVTSLVAVLGVAGLALSLAAQNALANVAGGLVLLSSKPFVVGDYIEASGAGGTVISIGLAYTKIKTPDNKIICAPNSTISGEKITNFTAETLRRVDISVTIAPHDDLAMVKQALFAAIEATPGILDDPAPYVNAQSYEANGVAYTLRVWAYTHDFLKVRDMLLEQIQPACATAGVRLAYPRLTIENGNVELGIRN